MGLRLGTLLEEAGLEVCPLRHGVYWLRSSTPERPIVIRVVGDGQAHWISVVALLGNLPRRGVPVVELLRLSLEMDLWKVAIIGLDRGIAVTLDLVPEQATPVVIRASAALARKLSQFGINHLRRTGWQELAQKTHEVYRQPSIAHFVDWLVAAEVAHWQVKESQGNNVLVEVDGYEVAGRQLGHTYGAYVHSSTTLHPADGLFLLTVNSTLDGCKLGITPPGEIVLAAEVYAPADEVVLIHLVHNLLRAAENVLPVLRLLKKDSRPGIAGVLSHWRRMLFGI